MARRDLMPLEDSADSARLLEWATGPLRYGINNEEPFDWTSFQVCAYCNGLCSVFESADSVRQLLDKQRVPLFQGRYRELKGIATRGCKFAKYLMSYLGDRFEMYHGLNESIDLAFQRIDEADPSCVRLVSLVRGSERGYGDPMYLIVGSAHGKFTPTDPYDTKNSHQMGRQILWLLVYRRLTRCHLEAC